MNSACERFFLQQTWFFYPPHVFLEAPRAYLKNLEPVPKTCPQQAASSRQLPITSPEEWHSVASSVEAVDLDLVAADHQVRVDVGAVDAHGA
jgi:hypothetical protein